MTRQGPRGQRKPRTALIFAALAVAQLAAIASGFVPVAVVETLHAGLVLPCLRWIPGRVSALVPLSVAQCFLLLWLVIGLVALIDFAWKKRSRRRDLRPRFARLFVTYSILAAWLYLLGHGWTLARAPLGERIGLTVVAKDRAVA